MKFSKLDYRKIQELFENKLRNRPLDITSSNCETYEIISDGRKYYFKSYDWMYQSICITNTLDNVVDATVLPVDIHFYVWQSEFTSIAIQILKADVKSFTAF